MKVARLNENGIGVFAGWMELLYERPLKSPLMKSIPIPFGVDLKADVYLPVKSEGKRPLVIWLRTSLVCIGEWKRVYQNVGLWQATSLFGPDRSTRDFDYRRRCLDRRLASVGRTAGQLFW